MVKLFCAIVGVKGSAFSVEIDVTQSVGDLKKVIKSKKANALKNFDADQLQLFLAKGTDDKWLKDDDAAAQLLYGGEIHPNIQQMISVKQVMATRTLQRWLFDDNKMSQPLPEQIHVLVVVPYQEQHVQAQNVNEAAQMREIINCLLRTAQQLEQMMASLPHKSSKSLSNAALGEQERIKLKVTKQVFEFAPVEGEEAFWSKETQIKADVITNEADFDAFIIPFFSSILESCGLVYVNSERYQWFSQGFKLYKNKHLKPDGFATHPGMYRVKPEPQDRVHRPDGFRFGVAEEELFDCLILFESKLSLSDAAFGQVVKYLQNLCPEASAYAILFDRQSFWLISSYKGYVYRVQKAKWITRGSKSLFQNFICENTSPWVAYLTNACEALHVNVVEGDAFLGRGAYGRVFKVTGQDGKIFALKIATDVERLYRERRALLMAEHTGLTIKPIGDVTATMESGALLLCPVGKPLPRPTTGMEVRNLFYMLWQLHANNLAHGDPRVSNVILTEEKTLWIDLVIGDNATPYLKRRDAEILTRSILRLPYENSLSLALVQSLNSYFQCATQENLDRLAEEVASAAGFSD
ncbi:unnamed protein product [Peronospora farinosa]|uniref:Crinkler effector protein N-terminal domain-containing protein n=1 Tax=Peronospora farinosa TaxID=134698 RepID=A0AAV0TCL9_9STRA|nr:unnamed protein product [Peronospora farinosa]